MRSFFLLLFLLFYFIFFLQKSKNVHKVMIVFRVANVNYSIRDKDKETAWDGYGGYFNKGYIEILLKEESIFSSSKI